MKISNEELISDLQRVSDILNGHYISAKAYRKLGKHSQSTLMSRFGNWSSALKAAKLIHYDDSLIGQKFGLLTVIERTDDKDKYGYYLWHCKCDCGQDKLANQSDLKKGTVKTCGGSIHMGAVMRDRDRLKNEVLSGYEVEEKSGLRYSDFAKKKLKNNTSGYTGVYKRKNKWSAELIVGGVRYRANGFSTPKKAFEARIKMEEKYLPEKIVKYIRRKHDENI
ncbi:homing endonuclease associated repeat-containing protein [Enterococcus italicus]|uniref:homing endonuclease associated repeat-containing protein n=1 Tax=Enterococcus italicus TaxID=246144 RepID=UPI002073284D|nr:hypothetical protein [Enterococcus italicus]